MTKADVVAHGNLVRRLLDRPLGTAYLFENLGQPLHGACYSASGESSSISFIRLECVVWYSRRNRHTIEFSEAVFKESFIINFSGGNIAGMPLCCQQRTGP